MVGLGSRVYATSTSEFFIASGSILHAVPNIPGAIPGADIAPAAAARKAALSPGGEASREGSWTRYTIERCACELHDAMPTDKVYVYV
eukprot:1897512-Rhodomonas_salina.3